PPWARGRKASPARGWRGSAARLHRARLGVAPRAQAPQLVAALLQLQRSETRPPAGPLDAEPGRGLIARPMMHADQRVARLVEEMRVAEVEHPPLVPAGIHEREQLAPMAHHERIPR